MVRADVFLALRSDGVSVLLECTAVLLPAIPHWGADLRRR